MDVGTDKDLKYKIHYFCREKYFQTVQNLAVEGMKKFPGDVTFKMYSGFSLVLSGRYQEAIRELDSLQGIRDVNIGALLGLITAHKSCPTVDREAVSQLDAKLKLDRKNSTDMGLYTGALLLYYLGKVDKGQDYLDRFLKNNPDSPDALALKGWMDIASERSSKFKSALQCFNRVLELEKKNMDAALGQVKLREVQNDLDGAMTLLNHMIVKYPSASPPLIEKMKVQLSSSDWDQTIDIANRILTINKSIEALRMKSLALICRDGNVDETALSLRRLLGEMEHMEPKNAKLFLENAQLFSYLAGRNIKILSETIRFAERAAQQDPGNVDFITELGNQCLMQGKMKDAMKYFKNTTKLDNSSVSALIGLTLCQIEEGGVNEPIKQQVEFLREIQSEQPSPVLLLMSAKLEVAPNDALRYLNHAVDAHFSNFKKYHYGVRYLYHLNPDFLMQVVKEYLRYSPSHLRAVSDTAPPPEGLAKSLMVLEELTSSCPGLLEPQYEYAHVQYLTGNMKGAKATLSHILDDLDATAADAHILMAQIHLQEKSYHQAAQSLEVGLSYNFRVREHPLYHLITAMVHKQNGKVAECIACLKAAMSASGLRAGGEAGRAAEFDLAATDKAMMYLELAEAYQQNGQMQEASGVIQDAIEQFKGSPEEGRVVIANAELSVQKGNINHAIEQLQKIQPGQSYYVLSKTALANIYLTHKKDRESFAECYKELCENAPSAHSYVLLGDAFMSIQEPDRAIEAYEQALKGSPKDGALVCKMGKALVKTHHFTKAINYYRESAKSAGNVELVFDMAELYFKLGQLDNAERALVAAVDDPTTDLTDVAQLCARTKLLRLLAKVRDKSGNLTESLSALKAAKENHARVEKRSAGMAEEHRQTIADISSDMAVLMTRLRDFNGAIRSYKESLAATPGSPQVLVALSRLYMQVNDLEECQATSQRLLAADPSSEPATVMLADLAFRKVDFETAAHHFKQLLAKRPTYWVALARLIEVLRRTGNLQEVAPYLEVAEAAEAGGGRPGQEAGFAYCKGLFEWHTGKPTSAIHHFNKARRDSEWGEQATYNMIEICLNPDNDTLGGESFSDEQRDEEGQDSKEMALRTAQRLLREVAPRHSGEESLNHRLLEDFWLLATKQKGNIEKALQDLTAMASHDLHRDHVGVALGIATAYMLQKQVQKARNQLKRMVKSQWSYEDAEYLERSWLLLTDIYIQSGKLDLPADLIQRILVHNRSCYKAYEYAGYIAEKEQLYKDAAVHYENAWRYGGQSKPAIGYKLAFNYLKGKRHADAIDVCHAVLRAHPDYPRIQKDILDKASSSLRT